MSRPSPPSEAHSRPGRPVRLERDASAFISRVDGDIESLVGWSADELLGKPSTDFIHPQDQPRAVSAWMDMLANPGRPVRGRSRYRTKSGGWVWVQSVNTNLLDDPGHGCVRTLMHAVDAGELSVEERLRARERLLDRLSDALPVGVVHIDANGVIVTTNERLHAILGHRDAVNVVQLGADVVEADQPVLRAALRDALTGTDVDDLEVRVDNGTATARVCWVRMRSLTDDEGKVEGVVGTVSDVTEQVKLRHRLEHSASTDDLTGCLNRRVIREELATVLGTVEESRRGLAVAFIDLNGFKRINDEHGHWVGDQVLASVGQRLRGQVRERDLVGRLGGDEFLVICPDISPDDLPDLAGRLRDAADHTLPVGDLSISVTSAVGITHTTAPAAVDAIIADADAAMYRHKPATQPAGGAGSVDLGA